MDKKNTEIQSRGVYTDIEDLEIPALDQLEKNLNLEDVDLSDLEIPTLDQLERELEREYDKNDRRRLVKKMVYSLMVVAASIVLIVFFFFPGLRISGTSMSQTLQDGDFVVTVKRAQYQNGDVIAFYYNSDILVKRVVAFEGSLVDIDEKGDVYVDGEFLDEPYVTEKDLGKCNIELPCKVPPGEVFVLGDHRSVSVDSRNTAVGCVKHELVVGKVLFRIWPFRNIGMVE